MLTGKQVRAIALRRGSPEARRRLLALERDGLVSYGGAKDKPDMIVGGSWPTDIRGALRATCADCKAYVALSPDSGRPMSLKFPDVPVVCFPCCERRARATE
jgi:hypothetical protein